MILGDYLNSGETKSIEYKEFCLKHKIFSCLDKQQRCEMVRNSKLPIFFNPPAPRAHVIMRGQQSVPVGKKQWTVL